MEKYFIGIDSGTSGIKAVLFDLKGNELGQKSFPLKGIFPREDMYEEDMLEIWDKAVKCVKAVTGHFRTKKLWESVLLHRAMVCGWLMKIWNR